MNLHDITPVVLTSNEERNIGRSLEQLRWARRVVVVDSGSTDGTAAIVATFPNAVFIVRPFDNHAAQWKFATQEIGIDTPWVLALDADYGLGPELLAEIEQLPDDANVAAYQASFTYCVWGRPIRSSAYVPVAVLFRREQCHYEQDGHTQRLVVDRGTKHSLRNRIRHDDRKPLSRFLSSQCRYMGLEADKLLASPGKRLSLADRVRKTIFLGPPAVLFYCLVLKLGILDGWAGWYYAFQRLAAETILSLKLIERRLGINSNSTSSSDTSGSKVSVKDGEP